MKISDAQVKSFCLLMIWTILLATALPQAHAAGERLLVSNLYDSSVLEFNGTTGTFVGVFVPPGSGGLNDVQGLTFGPDGNLYVSSHGNGSIKRYDGNTGAFIDDFVPSGRGGLESPDEVVFGPDGHLYVSDRFRAVIERYNGTTGAFIDTFVSDSRLEGFVGFTFGPDNNLYASMFNCCGEQRVLRYNGATGAFIDVFTHGGPAIDSAFSGLTFGTDGNLYAGRFHERRIERYNGATGAFIDTFVAPGSGGLVAGHRANVFGPDGHLYVASDGNGAVLRYNGKTGAFIDVFASRPGFRPVGIAFSPDLVAFATFTPRAAVKLGPQSQDDSLNVSAQFSLGAESDGIDPVHEDVALTFGSFSTTIPAGEFQQQGSGLFTFTGAINNVDLQAEIHVPQDSSGAVAAWGNRRGYSFTLQATGANLDGTVVPPKVQLAIGNDRGQTTITVGKARFGKGTKEGQRVRPGVDD